jgi:hypothetical protein
MTEKPNRFKRFFGAGADVHEELNPKLKPSSSAQQRLAKCLYLLKDTSNAPAATVQVTVLEPGEGNQILQRAASTPSTQLLDEPHTDLWRDAYMRLRQREPSIVKAYKDILAKDVENAEPLPLGPEKLMSGIITETG